MSRTRIIKDNVAVWRMHNEEKKSYEHIAYELGVSWITIYRSIKRYVKSNEVVAIPIHQDVMPIEQVTTTEVVEAVVENKDQ